MTPERWQQIKTVFNYACERAPEQQPAFLAEVCADDAELRREVETLLATHAEPGEFMQRPLVAMNLKETAPTAELVAEQQIGPYRIERRLGAGGMGVVYLARDTRLGRPIALKLLKAHFTQNAERVARFQQEARAVSALNHPNILTIHEIGQDSHTHFIATEFVDGLTLRELFNGGGLKLSEALDLLIQTAAALAAAHEAGVVHRDIKPENIMARRDGIVKVLDFGLAKLSEQAAQLLGVEFLPTHTQPGVIVGSVNYMSPEQARGLEVSAPSDLFSLGVVMYEMLVGRSPFDAATTGDMLAALLSAEPAPLSHSVLRMPAALQKIVSRALAKPVEQRYQTACEFGDDLKQLKRELELASDPAALRLIVGTTAVGDFSTLVDGQPALDYATRIGVRVSAARGKRTTARMAEFISYLQRRRKPVLFTTLILVMALVLAWIGWRWSAPNGEAITSIAVLPFANVGNDQQMEYLPEGITESLIGSLSQLPDLTVMARSTVFTYKGREVDPRQAGAALNVRAVLLGRVERQGESLLIHAELVDAKNGARLWGERYQRPLTDLPAVQEEITREISAALQLRLSGAQRQQLAKRRTEDSAAYQLYLRGRHLYYQAGRANQEKALDYYQQAIALDPRYALAYAGIAQVYATFSAQYLPPNEAMPKSRAAAQAALRLDDALPEAHFADGLVKIWGDWDWAGAEREFMRSIELNPSFVDGHIAYANLLTQQGRFDEALRETRRVQELDPLSASPSLAVGSVYYQARQFDQAIARFKQIQELYPEKGEGHRFLGIIYSLQGRHEEALKEFRLALSLNEHQTHRAWLAYGYGRAGQRGAALKILGAMEKAAERERVSPVYFARIYIGLGELDQAFEWLSKSYKERNDNLLGLGVNPEYDPLRSDPRFTELLRGIGLTH